MSSKFVGVTEVADILGCREQRVYDLIANEGLPGFKIASRWRFDLEDVEAWIEEQKAASARARAARLADRDAEASR